MIARAMTARMAAIPPNPPPPFFTLNVSLAEISDPSAFFAVTVSCLSPAASAFGRLMLHLPRLSAVVDVSMPSGEILIVTVAFGSLDPESVSLSGATLRSSVYGSTISTAGCGVGVACNPIGGNESGVMVGAKASGGAVGDGVPPQIQFADAGQYGLMHRNMPSTGPQYNPGAHSVLFRQKLLQVVTPNVGEGVGVRVAVGRRVGDGVRVGEAVGELVGVCVGDPVGVCVAVAVGVFVLVGVWVGEPVAVLVGVGEWGAIQGPEYVCPAQALMSVVQCCPGPGQHNCAPPHSPMRPAWLHSWISPSGSAGQLVKLTICQLLPF